MTRGTIRLGASAMMLCLLCAGPATAATHPQTRNGWVLGFGVGGGSAGSTSGGGREAGFAGSFRGGYAFTPELSLEMNSSAWAKTRNGVTLTFNVTALALDYYPGGSGFVLRAGLGSGEGRLSTTSGNTLYTSSEGGLGFTLGAGYEFRLGRSFALSPQVDYGRVSLDGGDFDFVNGALGFTWYFNRR